MYMEYSKLAQKAFFPLGLIFCFPCFGVIDQKLAFQGDSRWTKLLWGQHQEERAGEAAREGAPVRQPG